jgi:isoleucyl-tRNA synthetase
VSNYKPVESNPDFPKLEKKVLSKWQANRTFNKSIKGDKEFVFYDGPPFANGLPHYGHLLTGFIKDIFARYQTIIGKKVERRFGWDCHGLPAEMAAEKELGISGKVAIEKYGIDKFNDYCKTSVMRYTKEWEAYVNRQARWVDMENDYKTMDINYMESVLWAFKELHKKGYLYESMRVMPYSWACETPVSDFETRMDNSYREKTSKSVTITFTLLDKPKIRGSYSKYKILAWTTTPWTLPSNLALAVGADIDYVAIEKDGECYIIAQNLAATYEKEIGNQIVDTFKGEVLVGLKYEPLFKYFADEPNAFKVLSGDFVTTEDGTGIVHMAPGFGEDDQKLCAANDIAVVCPVDSAGKFVYPVTDYAGMQVFEANDPIIIALKQQGSWLRTEQYIHNYPHCWRTDTPLIYKALPSWYVKVTAFKDRMIANNQQINWIPGHVRDGLFGRWLENARDWSISRNRYWGCPIPVWKSDDPKYPHIEVYGSIAELEEAFGVEVKDLHRPFIDSLVKPNPSDPTGKSMLRRVSDVLDCWFESGSMPYGQAHYPFENKQWFEQHAPADFIVEYVAQTRGWFYTLLVLSTALFDRPPFLNCICHGVILGDGGQKLSKRLKNYADPNEVFDSIGADAMRWFMISSPVMRGQELVIDKDAKSIKEAVRKVIKPFWNAYNFFVLYANADGITANFSMKSENLMDRYILSKLFALTKIVKKSMDAYDTVTAAHEIEAFVEVLNNWYIRRSRERFWKTEKDQDKLDAYNTLYTVLHALARMCSPLLPMICDEVFAGLSDEFESVHLADYPELAYEVDQELIKNMDRVRSACTAAHYIRNETAIRVRQPLAKVTFIGVAENAFDEALTQLILDEINVKAWDNLPKDDIEKYANYKLQIKFPVLGKRLPAKVKEVIAAQKAGQWQLTDGKLTIAGEVLSADEYDLMLEPKPQYLGQIAALDSNDALVYLDLNISEELKLEGVARDLVRAIQQERKDMNLDITSKIKISIDSENAELQAAIAQFKDYILEQTLGEQIELTKLSEGKVVSFEGIELKLLIS